MIILTELKVPTISNIEKLGLSSGVFSIWESPSPLEEEKPALPTFVAGGCIEDNFFPPISESETSRLIIIFY